MKHEDPSRKKAALAGVLGAGVLGFGALALMLKAGGPTVIRPPERKERPVAPPRADAARPDLPVASTSPAAALPPLESQPLPETEIRRVEGDPIILDAVPNNAAPGGVYEDPRTRGKDTP